MALAVAWSLSPALRNERRESHDTRALPPFRTGNALIDLTKGRPIEVRELYFRALGLDYRIRYLATARRRFRQDPSVTVDEIATTPPPPPLYVITPFPP